MLNRHAFDLTDPHLSGFQLILHQSLQNAECLCHDDRTNAIARQYADDDLLLLGEILDLVVLLHALDTLKFRLDQLCKFFLCYFNVLGVVTHCKYPFLLYI